MKKKILHVYGKVAIASRICPNCGTESFVIGGKLICCDLNIESVPTGRVVVECASRGRRAKPSISNQKAILKLQDNRCLYCEAEFGSERAYKGRNERVNIHWDHFVPFSYTGTNTGFVAACSRCNLFKSSLHFPSLQDVKTHCQIKLHENKEAP